MFILCGNMVRCFIDGQTPQNERMRIFQNFVYNPLVNTIFISKVNIFSDLFACSTSQCYRPCAH